MGSHLPDDLLRKSAGLGRCADHHCGMYRPDDCQKACQAICILKFRTLAGKWLLLFSQAFSILKQQPLLVNKVEMLSGFLFAQA